MPQGVDNNTSKLQLGCRGDGGQDEGQLGAGADGNSHHTEGNTGNAGYSGYAGYTRTSIIQRTTHGRER